MTLHVERLGAGPDLVLLHGWAMHSGMWGPWLEDLRTFARLHVLDLPGHGCSRWPKGVHDLRDLAREVRPHVPRGAAVLGWSLGGMVALQLAHDAPRLPSALVLVATTPRFVAGAGWEHGMRSDVLDEFVRGLAGNWRRTVQNFLALQTHGEENALDSLRMLRRSLDSHGAPDRAALDAGLSMLRDSDLRPLLQGIALPTLVIAGDHDRLTPPTAGRALAAAMPSARLRLIERSGHAPFLSHGPVLAGEIRAFLARRQEALPAAGACA